MGRKFAIDWLPHYREVLVANAVQAVRGKLPTFEAFAVERRTWLGLPSERAAWHSVAISAGSAVGPTGTR
jgi:hypothetical protein